MGDRIAILKQGGVPRPVRDPGRAADGARRRLRRGLRRRRPRPQAAGADAGPRHRPLGGAAGLRRPGDQARCARSWTAPRSPTPCWSTPSAARSAGSRSATWRRRPCPSQPDSGPDPILDPDDVLRDALADCSRPRPSTRRSSTARAGSPACSPSRSSPSSSPRPRRRSRSTRGRAPPRRCLSGAAAPLLAQVEIRDRSEDADCVADNGALLLRLGGRQLRPLRHPTLEHIVLVMVSVVAGFLIALRARPALASPALADAAADRRHRDPLHDPLDRLLRPAAADHRARDRDGDHRPHRLHPADHLPEHRRRPRQRPEGGQGRRAAGWG